MLVASGLSLTLMCYPILLLFLKCVIVIYTILRSNLVKIIQFKYLIIITQHTSYPYPKQQIITAIMSQQQHQQSLFDISKLSTSSLRKYQSYFGINCTDQQLKQKVKQHFDKDLKAQPNQVIDRFLELKREDKDKKGGRARNPRMPPV